MFTMKPLKPHRFAFIISDKPQFPEVPFSLSWWFSLGNNGILVSSTPLTKPRSALSRPQSSYPCTGTARKSCFAKFFSESWDCICKANKGYSKFSWNVSNLE